MAQFIENCKEAVWSRGRHENVMGLGEILTGLGERHNVIYGKKQHVKVENVVIIKGDKKIEPYQNSGQWQ